MDKELKDIGSLMNKLRDLMVDLEEANDGVHEFVIKFISEGDDIINDLEDSISDLEYVVNDMKEEAEQKEEEAENMKGEYEDLMYDAESNYTINAPTVYDVIKMELLEEVFDKYSLEELQHILRTAEGALSKDLSHQTKLDL